MASQEPVDINIWYGYNLSMVFLLFEPTQEESLKSYKLC